TAQRAGEGHESGIAGAAGDIGCIEPLAGAADDVDDDATAARPHRRDISAAQIDVAEDFEVPGLAPARLVDLVERAAGDRAGIVHQDVDLRMVVGKAARRIASTEIER